MLLEFLSSLLLFCWSYCPIGRIFNWGSFFFLDQLLFCWCYCQIHYWFVDVIVRSVAVCLCLNFFVWIYVLFCCNSFWLISYSYVCRNICVFCFLLLLLACCLLCCVVSVSVDWSVIALYFESCFSRSVVEGPVVSFCFSSCFCSCSLNDCWLLLLKFPCCFVFFEFYWPIGCCFALLKLLLIIHLLFVCLEFLWPIVCCSSSWTIVCCYSCWTIGCSFDLLEFLFTNQLLFNARAYIDRALVAFCSIVLWS